MTCHRRAWGVYALLIYAYLYLCIFFGNPFIAFDHENYINFLNDPFPFLFEPGYTLAGYLINGFVEEQARFPVMFAIFTLPPLLIVWFSTARSPSFGRGMMIFACVLTKSFYIGFIAQRFFFAELWVAALTIASMPRLPKYKALLIPGLLHFSVLATLPCLAWLNSAFSWRKLLYSIGALILIYAYIMVFSGFQLLGYDYSRYLNPESMTGNYSLFTLLESVILLSILKLILPKDYVGNFVVLVCLIYLTKMIFSGIEVFSRVFQIQVDVIIIMAGLHARNHPYLLYYFCLGFLILQIFFTPTSVEMSTYHSIAVMNAWSAF